MGPDTKPNPGWPLLFSRNRRRGELRSHESGFHESPAEEREDALPVRRLEPETDGVRVNVVDDRVEPASLP